MRALSAFALSASLLFVPLVTSTPVPAAGVPSACQTSPAGHGYNVLTLPGPGISRLYAATAAARHTIDVVMYELTDPTELAALTAAARRGVDVHVILDYAYAGKYVNVPAFTYLTHSKVHVAWGPASTIVHQKTIVVDDSCAFIGTGNLTPRYYASTRDFWIVDTNHAEVAAIAATTLADFARPALATARSAGNLLYSPGAETPLVNLIHSATTSISLESEEMSEPYITTALVDAAHRGVRCTITMVENSSWNAAFSQLAAAGCHIDLYSASGGLYIHAKAMVVDAGTTHASLYIGSQNDSIASLLYDRELGLIVSATSAPTLVAQVTAVLARDAAAAPRHFS
jgi:phosphatidylserine/phosphatidylglycerophosphate/cardiolipin synthase-like enzyme